MPAKKVLTKKKTAKKTSTKKKPKLICDVCGFAVTVDTECGCEEEHTLICCDEEMMRK